MEIRISDDKVVIEGYVNAVERNSKPLHSRQGKFIERIQKGAFATALKNASDVRVLRNHDWSRDLGGTKDGNLELREDSIGLHAKLETGDAATIEDARKGNLIGWSFGFYDKDVERRTEDGMPLRIVKDMDLREVSIIDRMKSPAYEGTLIMARADENGDIDVQNCGETLIGDVQMTEVRSEEPAEERSEEPKQEAEPVAIDYSKFDAMIAEMKGAKVHE